MHSSSDRALAIVLILGYASFLIVTGYLAFLLATPL
jgi:hypothetical protein